jgi:polyisoprenoid-binding protein YceI
MLVRAFWGFAVLVLLSTTAFADPAKWQVDPAKSSLQFVVDVNGQTVTGRFRAFGALIAFDPADLAHSSAKITIDMTEAKSGDATRDAMLLKPDWFNVLDFPQAIFQTTSFASKGGSAYEAHGKLTLKGVTRDIVLPLTIAITGDMAVAKGEVVLKRAEFKVGQGGQFDTDKPVALGVKVLVNVTAKRAK